MNVPDLINGAFELTGGVVCWLNVRRLLRDRRVQGVDWRVSAFFSAWGFWNLFYYPSLSQWASFAGGVTLVVANTTWVVLALRIIKAQKAAEEAEELALENDPDFDTFLEALPEDSCHCECDICTDTELGNIP